MSFFAFGKKVQNYPSLLKWGYFYALALCSALQAGNLKVEVSAKAAILLNAETGAILYEKNAYLSLYPASITKIATALYALEKKGHALSDKVVASSDAVSAVSPQVKRAATSRHPAYRLEFGGSSMGLKVGEEFPLGMLFYGLMLSSGNDAANAIAEYVSGSVGQFVQELNAYIRSKGCTGTTFVAPHGLHHVDHKTTAYDMAILTREALRIPFFRTVVRTVSCPRPASNQQPESTLQQHNALVKPNSPFYYPKAIGVKTGYTAAAGYTLVAAAEDPQRKLIAVLLGCEKLDQRYRDAIALFDAAYNEPRAERTLFSRNFDSFTAQICGGKKMLQAALLEDLVVQYYPSEGEEMLSKVVWEDMVLPIRKDARVGEVRVFSKDGRILARSPLFATNDVHPKISYLARVQCQAFKSFLWAQRSYVLYILGCVLLGSVFLWHRKKVEQS
jgi:D-alanyl-D-alanine carboxypeptidase (penicillin-binding protein 5/6)